MATKGRPFTVRLRPDVERRPQDALAFYPEHTEEIDRHLRVNDRTPEEWDRMYPGLAILPPRDVR